MGKKLSLIGVIDGNVEVEKALEELGAITVTIDDIDVFEDKELREGVLDGIVLCGGTDVNPTLYGATDKHSQVWIVDDTRDKLEIAALEYAAITDTPVFGICRGSQIINVWHGGTLHQHIDDFTGKGTHFMSNHWVELLTDSHISKATKAGGLLVNSIHHQAVDRIGEGLIPVAWSHDGVIEAIESMPWAKQFIMGVQFHPEMLNYRKDMQRILRRFVQASRRHSQGKASTLLREVEVEEILSKYEMGGMNHEDWEGWSYGWDTTGDDRPWVVESRQEENDYYCAFPPCRWPQECRSKEGDCLAAFAAHERPVISDGKRGRSFMYRDGQLVEVDDKGREELWIVD